MSREKREYLEPSEPSAPSQAERSDYLIDAESQVQRPDYLSGPDGQVDPMAASSSRVPPAYADADRGFNGYNELNSYSAPPNTYSAPPTAYPLYPPPTSSPPYTLPYPASPPVGPPEPIHLTLLNPRMVSSGFSMVMPDSLHQLAPRPVNSATWTAFMHELNDVLHKAPGTV
ncbi:hypothetical protein IWW38_003397, partial [Coemansia aciculifera]